MVKITEETDVTTRKQKWEGVTEIRRITKQVPGLGRTVRDIAVTFGASGCPVKHDVVVPKGTLCREIVGEPANLFVEDLSWIPRTSFMEKHDATYYGIRIKREDIKMEDSCTT